MAVVAVPLIGAIGLALDYGHAYDIRTHLMTAADSAALGSISEGSRGYLAAGKKLTDGIVEFDSADVVGMFVSNANQVVPVSSEDVSISVEKIKDDVSATVKFSVEVPTVFMQILGKKSVTVAGSATAGYAASAPSYMDVHMLLDNSPSMGLGATKQDLNDLIVATKGCAFACHEVWESGVEKENTNYKIARREGITLRIDVLRSAVLELVDYADELQGSSSAFRFSAYSMGKAALKGKYQIDTLSKPTSDLRSVKRSVEDLTLMSTPGSTFNEDALTSFDNALKSVGDEIKQDGGSGSSDKDREQVVLFVTDGVGNSIKPSACTGFYDGNKGRCFEPIDIRLCDALKKRNIKVAVLYTTYVPVDDHLYNTYVAKFANLIAPKLQECASPELYGEAKMGGDMEAEIKKLFGKAAISKRLRLTN